MSSNTVTTDSDTSGGARAPQDRRALAVRLAAGAVCGLAWASGLRGAMAALAGTDSTVSWPGTFGWIIAPGIVVGLLLGWSDHLRRTQGRRQTRIQNWLVFSPVLLTVVLLGNPAALQEFLRTGIGGGAIGVPLFGIMGGYAMSTRGPLWTRVLCRVLLLAPVPAGLVFLAATQTSVTPRAAWIFLYFYSFILVLGIGCSIPHRRFTDPAAAPG